MKGLLHGIERLELTCKAPDGDDRIGPYAAADGAHIRNRHPVFGQGAGLVGAQHRGGAEGFDRGGAARQHAGAARFARLPSP